MGIMILFVGLALPATIEGVKALEKLNAPAPAQVEVVPEIKRLRMKDVYDYGAEKKTGLR